MSGIKGRDTRPELIVRRYLHAARLRFRLHDTSLPGKPDIVFPSYRTVVFVHGCFWHSHPNCKFSRLPASRFEFWNAKLAANVQRDSRNEKLLSAQGWTVLIIWECETRNPVFLDQLFWSIVAQAKPSN